MRRRIKGPTIKAKSNNGDKGAGWFQVRCAIVSFPTSLESQVGLAAASYFSRMTGKGAAAICRSSAFSDSWKHKNALSPSMLTKD